MLGQQLRLPYDFALDSSFSSLVDIDTEVARQLVQDNFDTKKVLEAKKLAATNSRILETDLEVGNYAFIFDDRQAPGIPYKLRIPYRGPYRIIKLYDNNAILNVNDEERKVNITKLIKLKDFTLPRDLKGRATDLEKLEQPDPLEETFEQAKQLTDKLLRFKRDGKIWQQAKAKVKNDIFKGLAKDDSKTEVKTEIEDEVEGKIAETAKTIRAHEKTLKIIASTQILSRFPLSM